jgi:hypothetical protein
VTFPEGPGRWIDRNVARITVTLAVGTILCLVGLGYLNTRVSGQAADGRDARVQQCRLRPITVDEQRWFAASGVISGKQLGLVLGALPSREECAALLRR